MINHKIVLEDTTLRDGEQTPGLFFTKEEKLLIHNKLVEAGVKWIEAGIPAMGGEEVEYLKMLVAQGSDATLIAWNRGILEDVEFSLKLGFKAIHIGLPTSEIHLKNSIGKDKVWLLSRAKELIDYAKSKGAFVSISSEDVGRTDRSFLQEYAGIVFEAGADRLRLSDTIGILTPEQYGEIVKSVVSSCPIPVQCHTHNDYGLALANLLSGLNAGATYFHVTVNGIGERAGMTDLAQAYMVLKNLYGIDLGLNGTKLSALSSLVEELSGIKMPPWCPIVGSNVFAHESGIHVNGMLHNSNTFEPFDPSQVGGSRKYVLGKHSGRALIAFILYNHNMYYDDSILRMCLSEVRSISIKQKKPLSNEELFEIYYKIKPTNATN